MHGCERRQHGFVQDGSVGVHGSGVLTEIVQPGKGFAAVAWKGTLAGVFSIRQMCNGVKGCVGAIGSVQIRGNLCLHWI